MLKIACLCSLLILTGCSSSQANISPEGDLEVFGNASSITAEDIPADWVLEGINTKQLSSQNISINNANGSSTLRLISSENKFILLRRTRASLLASPFLGWSWKVSPPLSQIGAIRLIIGFHGGNLNSSSWVGKKFLTFGTNIPPYDRVISIAWGAKSDTKGSFKYENNLPIYILRTGSKQTKTWLTENIDLSNLYRQLWPNDNAVQAHIIFVGFSCASAETSTTAEFRDLALYR